MAATSALPPREHRIRDRWTSLRRGWGALLVGLVSALPATSSAEDLDVRGWLDRPGVKLLAVEFYATWCRPCMEAVPRWRALHERYRREGLRLVVVSTRDPGGGCRVPGWNPDAVICDDDGRLADRLGANPLPAAFLWSWQGHLLASGAEVDEVARAIERWMAQAPRVDVQAVDVPEASGLDAAALQSAVRSELSRTDKLVVVATEAEREELRALVRASMGPFRDDEGACEVGQEISANSLLQAGISAGARPRLHLRLLSAERGCLVAAGSVPWNPDKPSTSVGEGVSALLAGLRLPTPLRPQPSPLEGRVEVVATRGGAPLVARVRVDGTPRGSTPAQLRLEPGPRAFELETDDGDRWRTTVWLEPGGRERVEARFDAPSTIPPDPRVEARIPPKPSDEGGGVLATGLVIMGAGAAGMVGGVLLFANDDPGAGLAVSGLSALAGGTGTVMVLVGGVMKLVSGARRRSWEQQYGRSDTGWSVGPSLLPGGAGLGLSGRF